MNTLQTRLVSSNKANKLPQELDRVKALANQYLLTKPKKAIEVTQSTIDWLSSIRTHKEEHAQELSELLLIQGDAYCTIGDDSQGLQSYQLSLNLIENRSPLIEIGTRLSKIGAVQAYLKNYSKALEILFRTLDIAQKIKDKSLEGQVLNHIGFIYVDLSEPMKGLSYLQQSYDILESSGSGEEIGNTINSLCLAYLKLGKYEKALSYGQKAASYFQNNEIFHLAADAWINIGQVYLGMVNLTQAHQALLQANHLAQTYSYNRQSSMALCLIGKIQIEQKQYEEAKRNIKKSLELAEEINLHSIKADCHLLLSEMFASLGNLKLAYEHHKKYHSEKEKTYLRDIANRVRVLELSHNLETAKNISDALQEQNEALREEVRLRKLTHAKLEELSRVDPLTGIYNRRHFFDLAEREFSRARRYKRPVSAIMIDLDHFKTINDNHGHIVGDQVLAEVALRIQQNSREVDVVGRYGGEEFIILLPETALDDALILAERIWKSLTTRPASTSKLTLPLQASMGVSCCKNGIDTPLYDLIEQADKALYRAKDLGRNRIEVFHK
jgi:diguanylate cyclase (GGDEF)-like protein